MKEIYLVRHAESEHHINNLTGGWTNTGITEIGARQANLLGERLIKMIHDQNQVSIFSSDLVRAKETALILTKFFNVDVTYNAGLRELNNGSAAGLTTEEAKIIENPMTRPTLDWVPYPEAESWRMMENRVFKCMDQISKNS